MKRFCSLLAALLPCLLATAQVNMPVPLVQYTEQPLTHIIVEGDRSVSVVQDTVDLVAVIVTLAQPDQMPALDTTGMTVDHHGTLRIAEICPYRSRIQVHTTAQRLYVEARGLARMTLTGLDTLRFDTLDVRCYDDAQAQVEQPVAGTFFLARADGHSSLHYRGSKARRTERYLYGGGRVIDTQSDSVATAVVFEYNEPPTMVSVGKQMLRYLDGFHIQFSLGFAGWERLPFNLYEFAPTIGDAFMQEMVPVAFSFGSLVDVLTRRHWRVFIGLTAEMMANTRLYEGYVDAVQGADGRLTLTATTPSANLMSDIPYSVRSQYIEWNTEVIVPACLGLPVGAEWNQRADRKGWHAGLTVTPMVSIHSKKAISLVNVGTFNNQSISGYERQSNMLSRSFNHFRLDVRLSVGYGHFDVYMQSAVTPLFRTSGDYALNYRLYPYSYGIAITF